MPAVPEVLQKTGYLTIFEIAQGEVIIITRRPDESVCMYAGLIVKFKHKREIKLYETKPVYASAMEANHAMLHVRSEAQKFVEEERRK